MYTRWTAPGSREKKIRCVECTTMCIHIYSVCRMYVATIYICTIYIYIIYISLIHCHFIASERSTHQSISATNRPVHSCPYVIARCNCSCHLEIHLCLRLCTITCICVHTSVQSYMPAYPRAHVCVDCMHACDRRG